MSILLMVLSIFLNEMVGYFLVKNASSFSGDLSLMQFYMVVFLVLGVVNGIILIIVYYFLIKELK